MLTRFANVFFFNDTATTEIYTLSLHDALPIFDEVADAPQSQADRDGRGGQVGDAVERIPFAPAEGANGGDDAEQPSVEGRSEEHTSELQSQSNLVCRLLLEKKNTTEVNDTSKR